MELVDEYPILSKIFTLEKNSNNEVYVALYKYVREKYPGLFTPIGKMPDFVENYSKELIDYFESVFGLPFMGDYKVVIRPVVNNKTIAIPHKTQMKRVLIEKERFRDYLKFIYKKVNVGNGFVEVVAFKPSKFLVLLDPMTPLIDAIYIIAHEMSHVYSLSQVWQPMLNLQMLHIMSTSELLAVTLSYKYLVDNDFYYHFGMSNNLIHYEYYTYSVDYMENEKDLLKYSFDIMDGKIMVGTESVDRYKFSSIGRLIKFYSLLYELTVLNGSFMREIPLEDVLLSDYMFIYYLFNPEEFKHRFGNVYQLLTKAEEKVQTYHPIEGMIALDVLLHSVKNKVLNVLVSYNPDNNTIIQKQSFELFSYSGTRGEDRVLLR